MIVDVKVIWNDKLSFTGSGGNDISVRLEADSAPGGEIDGFKPMELIAIGLAGCTALDTMSILQKKQQDITAFKVQMHAERALEFPKVFTLIILEYIVEGYNIDPAAVERSIELSATKYCPA